MTVSHRCSCGCCRIVFETAGDDDVYFVTVESSVAELGFTLRKRIKAALAILRKCKATHAEVVFTSSQDFQLFVHELDELAKGKSV